MEEYFENGKEIPKDLWNCMVLAHKEGCHWLCLDADGSQTKDLETYLETYE